MKLYSMLKDDFLNAQYQFPFIRGRIMYYEVGGVDLFLTKQEMKEINKVFPNAVFKF